MKYGEWRERVEELKNQWSKMWRQRIDDKVRAEGIANQHFPELFVEQGRVIVATRSCKPPDFREILEGHKPEEMKSLGFPPHPWAGGYGKFIREVICKQRRYGSEDRRRMVRGWEEKKKERQQLKKGGKGWLHFRMR